MEKLFFITAMLFNAETFELEPRYNQSVYFYDRINCEAYVQQNWSLLHDTLQVYLEKENDDRVIQSIGCSSISADDLEKLLEDEELAEPESISA